MSRAPVPFGAGRRPMLGSLRQCVRHPQRAGYQPIRRGLYFGKELQRLATDRTDKAVILARGRVEFGALIERPARTADLRSGHSWLRGCTAKVPRTTPLRRRRRVRDTSPTASARLPRWGRFFSQALRRASVARHDRLTPAEPIVDAGLDGMNISRKGRTAERDVGSGKI